jgi:exodeoxyribonuclease V alpha subunit
VTRSIPSSADPDTNTLAVLEGVVDRIVYANEDTAWTVARLTVAGRPQPVTIVGSLLGVQPGETVRLHGSWGIDRRYGEQFRVQSYLTVSPTTLTGIEKYLASGLVEGIGPVMAERLVRHFGIETLEIIERQTERLAEVEGIGPVRTERIRAAWVEQREIKDVMVFLQAHEVSTTYAIKIYKEYGTRAVGVVTKNPYRLAVDIFGIGFQTADRIAASLGIEPTSPRRAEAGLLHLLGERASNGHVYYPRQLLIAEAQELLGIEVATIEQALSTVTTEGRVVVERVEPRDTTASTEGEGGAREIVYQAALHRAESGLAESLGRLGAGEVEAVGVDLDRALAWCAQQSGLTLAAQQEQAVRAALTSAVVVITGGPGTGKTTVIDAIARILVRKGRRVMLTAPTGRAAKRMAEATGREARTIHRLLEFTPASMEFARDQEHPLDADVLIVDEASMIDVTLAHNLMKAVPPGCQVVFVGDVDQLPSVGAGSVLDDLIRSEAVPVVALTEIFRQAAESLIVTNAHRVNHGEMPTLPPDGDLADFYIIERGEPEEVVATIKDLVGQRIPSRFGFDPIEEIQVLTPMNRGVLGVLSLNAELQALLNPADAGDAEIVRGGRAFHVGDKVMQLRNNYDLDVFNGDIGRVVRIDTVDRTMDVEYDGRPVSYESAALDEVALAYACSIHKSQGSEYPAVVLPMHTQHYVMLQRNLLYTALTRARRLVVVVGTKKALGIAIKNDSVLQRYTHLAPRLAGAVRGASDAIAQARERSGGQT